MDGVFANLCLGLAVTGLAAWAVTGSVLPLIVVVAAGGLLCGVTRSLWKWRRRKSRP